MSGINDDIRKINPGNLIDLYEIDFNPIGLNLISYLCCYEDTEGKSLHFQGHNYTAFPMSFTGFEKIGSGAEKRPKVIVDNLSGLFSTYLQSSGDLIGAKVIRKRTLSKYLGTETYDESTFAKETFYIEQKTLETMQVVEFDLASALDFLGKKLPGRTAVANACTWSYKSAINGSGCGFAGTDPTKWFNSLGTPVATKDLDVCGKRLSDCKLRFGKTNPLDYGGFPTLGRM